MRRARFNRARHGPSSAAKREEVALAERRNVILGAGLAGLTAAYALQQAGEESWVVLEKETRPGGHARSHDVDGYVFDYGPHILFTNDRDIEALIRELLGDNLRAQERQAFIYHRAFDLYTRFPFQAHLFGLPPALVKECLVGLVQAVERQARGEFEPRNYEEWMRGFFGDGIADRLMIPYARKLWTVEPSTMDFDWIGRRVPTPEVDRILIGALTDEVEQIGATANFWYPWRGGIEALPRALADRVKRIEYGCEVQRIDPERRVLELAGGDAIGFGELIFTLPLVSLPRFIPDLPSYISDACARLAFQGILNINLGVDRPSLSPYHWVYFYEDAFPFHRVSFPANFSPHNVPPGKSSIAVEVAYAPGHPPDTERFVENTIEALRSAGILAREDRIELVHVEAIAPAYVIYDLQHADAVETVVSWLRSRGIRAAGRFGEWQYFNMDHAMKSGWHAAHEILGQRGIVEAGG
jgi:protoporphyrinogen oxidase